MSSDPRFAPPPPYTSQPPHNMPPPPHQQGPVLIPMQTMTVVPQVITVQAMGSQPTPMVCRSCNLQIVTETRPKPTTRTHLFAILLCLIGCWPCACIPYCVDSCLNVDHYCPNCQAYIGSYLG